MHEEEADEEPAKTYALVNASELAQSISRLNVAVALRVFAEYLERTDSMTAREALADAIATTTDPATYHGLKVEEEAACYTKVAMTMLLELATRKRLR
jgi:hypothetical protein